MTDVAWPVITWLLISAVGLVYALVNLYDASDAWRRLRMAQPAHILVARMTLRRAALHVAATATMLELGILATVRATGALAVGLNIVALLMVLNILLDRRQQRARIADALRERVP